MHTDAAMERHRETCGRPFKFTVWVDGRAVAHANTRDSADYVARRAASTYQQPATVYPCLLCAALQGEWTVQA